MSTEQPPPTDTSIDPNRPQIRCPHCDRATVPIRFGYPGPEMFEASERGELELGGCCIFDGQPTHRCNQCGESLEARR